MDIIGLDAKWYKKTYPYTGTTYCGEEQTHHLQEKQTTKERGQESSRTSREPWEIEISKRENTGENEKGERYNEVQQRK